MNKEDLIASYMQSEQEAQEIIAELEFKNKKLQEAIDEIKKHCTWAMERSENDHPNNSQLSIGRAIVASIVLRCIEGMEDE